MTWRDQAIADIRVQEALRLTSYWDGEGDCWTNGYGHTHGVAEGQVIDQAQADEWLIHDVQGAETDLVANLPWIATAPDPVKRGMLNMCFNLGWPRLSLFTHMLLAGSIGDWNGMAEAALTSGSDPSKPSPWAKEVGERATFIAGLFRLAAQGVAA